MNKHDGNKKAWVWLWNPVHLPIQTTINRLVVYLELAKEGKELR